MKKTITLLMAFIFSSSLFAQKNLNKQEYLHKSKKKKTTAWVLLGGGVTVGLIGLTKINLAGSDGDINNGPGTALFVTGTVAALSSIPFFSASKRNKRKAMSMSFKNQTIPQLQNNGFVYRTIPSLNLKITL